MNLTDYTKEELTALFAEWGEGGSATLGHGRLGGEVAGESEFGGDVVGGCVVYLNIGEILAGVEFAEFLLDVWGGAALSFGGAGDGIVAVEGEPVVT